LEVSSEIGFPAVYYQEGSVHGDQLAAFIAKKGYQKVSSK
jgi:hypothetical protein